MGSRVNRLDQMIERLRTQKAYLDFAIGAIKGIPGVVFEIGLGKGRTYDYLRQTCVGREIYCFDREIHAPSDATPDPDHIFIGDFLETIPAAGQTFQGNVALIHTDFGSTNAVCDASLAKRLAPLFSRLFVADGLVVSDRRLTVENAEPLELPGISPDWPYFILRAGD